MVRRQKPMPGKHKAAELPSSMFILSGTNPFRRAAMWLVRWIAFEWLIILTIIANCVVMAMDEHLPHRDKSTLDHKLEELEPWFMGIFTMEMIVKILADGFILHKGSYLRNPWNIMDFIVVVSGFLPYLIPASDDGKSGPDLSTLRTFRVLRPLKLVSGVPSLQVVMSAIGKAIGPLVNIALLLLFAIIIFAIIGLEFYAGALNKTCYDIEDLNRVVMESESGNPCHDGVAADAPIGAYTCNQEVSICLEKWEGPNSGITSFDNIALAMLTVFQCVTMEGWTPILYWTNDALGSVFNWVFFIPLIVLGSFFMLNLVLGVLSGEFAKEKERVESRSGFMKLKEQQRLDKELNGYVQWICRAEDLVLAEERTSDEDRARITEQRKKWEEKIRKGMTTINKNDSVETNSVDDEDDGTTSAETNKRVHRSEKRFRFFIRRICKTSYWFWFVIALVFLNTCTVAVEHYNQPLWLTEFLYYAEFLFLSAFIFEMSIRMYALGVTAFFNSSFNRFDVMVITGSVLEVFWVNFHERAGSFGLSALRALRLLRVFKVTKYWSRLRNLVIALMNAISSILSLLFLLFLFIFIFALLGMQLFGGSFNFPEGTPTSNFNTIVAALLTVFQILTGEDWNQVMYTAINSKGGRANGGTIYSLYFVMLTLCGDYTLLNVFLAIACDSLDQAAALTEAEEAEKERQKQAAEQLLNKDKVQEEDKSPEEEIDPIRAAEMAFERAAEAAARAALQAEEEEEEEEERPILPYSSFFILSSTNPLRILVHWIVTKKVFDMFIMLIIVLSSIALASEDPVDEDSPRNKFMGYADYFFTAIFTLECSLKILDLGFILHPGAYMRDFWNFMDITVVTCALISFYHTIAGTPTGQRLKSLKLLRVLRPLKTINRIPQLKAVFDCVVISLKNVFNILVVYILFQFIFAVVGVQLFNGKFFYCTDESKGTPEECQGYFYIFEDRHLPPLVLERNWEKKSFHYDNCFMAMLTLFAVQTSEGWVAILQDSMSSTYEEEGPIPWFRVEMSIFYIVFFIVFPFFFVNIFVALIIVTFNELGEAELQDDMDKNQKSCIDFAIQAKPMELYVPDETSGPRYHIWKLVTSEPFENFILMLIVCNTILLMLKFHGAPLYFTDILSYFNLVFTLLFTVECIFKLVSFGPRNYFKDSWNTFDFITVVGSIIDATKMVSVGFLKLFRAARLIKLLRRSVSVRILLYTFVQSLKALPYVCMLMGMLFFIYAIVGMQLFGSMMIDPSSSIERHNNFRHFFQSLMLLFRCATGEAWPDIMLDAASGRPCDPLAIELNKTTGLPAWEQTCGSSLTYIYFVSFIFLCSFIMLNLFVAVIMDNFDYLTRDSSILGSHHLGEFINTWSNYDPSGTGKIHYTEVFNMLRDIDPPLGFGKKCPERMAYKKLIRMNMPMDMEGKVNFTTTLFALIRENLKINVRESSEMDQADIELRTTIIKCWPHTKREKIELLVPTWKQTGTGHLTVGKLYGGILIYDNWKKTKFGQIEVLRQQEAEIQELERAAKEIERAKLRQEAIDRGEDPDALIFSDDDVEGIHESDKQNNNAHESEHVPNLDDPDNAYYPEEEYYDVLGRPLNHHGVNKMPPIQEHGYEDEYGYVDEGEGNWGGWDQPWPNDYGHQDAPYTQSSVRSPSFSNFDPYYPPRPNGYEPGPPPPPAPMESWNQQTSYPTQRPNGTGRKLPQTPKMPSTLTNHLQGQSHSHNHIGNQSNGPGGYQANNSRVPNHVDQLAMPLSMGRKLPATPNKPSSLFGQTASMAFHNLTERFNKPSSLSFRPHVTDTANASPSCGSFSFPKLNGSPSHPFPNQFSGSAGFMGNFSGFSTPMDTVLDRFGRTGPAALHPPSSFPGQRKLPSLAHFGRSNSLGRNLPPIPSKPPTLVRRRTFEDDDYRTDWI
ncbi:voltage-dependent calcium channel type A subunit alpha-1-like [Tigriopus californicus]|uniref:voltage-dependent calcium channel type A subunit alpha-1-like n=1 Tax=Tigriopus californicus TaxID=6832 RepID=UPI0027DAA95D|nr:voltage-dependent calcium channel type A subunit alpha-1-like [Tigriopus californicus]